MSYYSTRGVLYFIISAFYCSTTGRLVQIYQCGSIYEKAVSDRNQIRKVSADVCLTSEGQKLQMRKLWACCKRTLR